MNTKLDQFILILIILSFLTILAINTFIQTQTQTIVVHYNQTIIGFYSHAAEIKVPAIARIGNKEKGVITNLKVLAIPGEGRTLTNIENLLFWIDTQYSIRTAKHVAERISQMNLSQIDLIYTIETNASIIEGQSAGAALTIATIAVLQNKSINNSVIITGTISEDGRIGKVGGIIEKASAAKEFGAKLFLVPKGQSIIINYVPEQKCEKIGPITFCRTEYKAEEINVSEIVGIEVKEVSSIEKALKYFLI